MQIRDYTLTEIRPPPSSATGKRFVNSLSFLCRCQTYWNSGSRLKSSLSYYWQVLTVLISNEENCFHRLGTFFGGCVSVKKAALNQVANALAGSGTAFASDSDPELIKQAVPFSLKLMESVVAENPRHSGLLTALCSGFTQYGYAFVQEEADEIESRDYTRADAQRVRARKLFLRARGYGLAGLELAHDGFTRALAANPRGAVRVAKKNDVPLLYWTAAAWGAAISLGKNDPALLAEIPEMEALIDRALELDETWDEGSLHEFLITYEMTRQGTAGDAAERAAFHFDRARELSHGFRASVYVAYAEAVCVEKQQSVKFEQLLQQALAIDPDAHPVLRLSNLVMQQRARWLLGRKSDLFLNPSG